MYNLNIITFLTLILLILLHSVNTGCVKTQGNLTLRFFLRVRVGKKTFMWLCYFTIFSLLISYETQGY